MTITYVKCDSFSGETVGAYAVEVDLGLGIDEAARILGVELSIESSLALADGVKARRAAYSFDPEDTTIVLDDDEQFAYLPLVVAGLGTSGGTTANAALYMDFTGMKLITSRNLAFLALVADVADTVVGKVFYEKYKPPVAELTQLIAARR
ncbi:hypothetical protein ES708_35043 [subsurface metagenome]|jgi:hypothetical protein